MLIKLIYFTVSSQFVMSTPSESSPLIKPSTRRKLLSYCSCHAHYRLPRIKEKGAIIVIVCNLLIVSAIFAQLARNYLMSHTFSVAILLMSTTFPIAGIVADICVGRFRVIQTSTIFLIVSSLFNTLLMCLRDYL